MVSGPDKGRDIILTHDDWLAMYIICATNIDHTIIANLSIGKGRLLVTDGRAGVLFDEECSTLGI